MVQALIDEQGDVVSAKAVSGHPFLWPLAEKPRLKLNSNRRHFPGTPVKVTLRWLFIIL